MFHPLFTTPPSPLVPDHPTLVANHCRRIDMPPHPVHCSAESIHLSSPWQCTQAFFHKSSSYTSLSMNSCHKIIIPQWLFTSHKSRKNLYPWKNSRIDIHWIPATKCNFTQYVSVEWGLTSNCNYDYHISMHEEILFSFAATNILTHPMVKVKIIFTGRIRERKPLPTDLKEGQAQNKTTLSVKNA